MDKPITIQIEEIKDNLTNILNNSNLPLFVIRYILKDLYSEVCNLYNQQVINDKTEYQNYINSQKNEN
jgi:hypothetical protein